MPLADRIVAGVVLAGIGGVLAVRAFRIWADFRRQRRALDLLVRSVTELEERPQEKHHR